MGSYVVPPEGLSWGPVEGFIGIGGMIITVIGGLLVTLSVIYLLVRTLITIVGKGKGLSKPALRWGMISLIAGLLFIGGGWYTLLRSGQTILIHNMREILNMDQSVEDNKPLEDKNRQGEWRPGDKD